MTDGRPRPEDHLGLIGTVRGWIQSRFRLTPLLDEDDIYQQGFLSLEKACRTWSGQGGAAFSTYACQVISRDLSKAAVRALSRQRRERPGFEGHTPGGAPKDGSMDAPRTRELLERMIRDLPPEHQRIMRLRYLDGWTSAEIAEHLGRSSKRQAIGRFLKRIRDRMLVPGGYDVSGVFAE